MDIARQKRPPSPGLSVQKVAVTGSAGAGKTLVCNRFKKRGVRVIQLDELAREVVAPGSAAFEKIVDHFGEMVLDRNGTVNRRKLRQMIIHDDHARKALERFVHPEISALMAKQMEKAKRRGEPIVVVEVPLLFEKGLEKQFQVVVLVMADRELRIKRLIDRDTISRNDAGALLRIQMPDDQKQDRADFIIKNNGAKKAVIRAVDLILEKLLKK